MTTESFGYRIGLAAGGVTIAMALFLTGFWAGSARGKGSRPDRAPHAAPAWFGPIWDYYDRNPAVTPEFDFAALYASDARSHSSGRQGAVAPAIALRTTPE
ncbi:MAG: hypothetical protein H0U00_05705 [Actinobacteria bacterium]|nr:hypothetical protein [Actinomycetota bacterium]